MRGISSLPSLVLAGYTSFGLALAFPFVFSAMIPTIWFFIDFFVFLFFKVKTCDYMLPIIGLIMQSQ
jgi:hypothetical protein